MPHSLTISVRDGERFYHVTVSPTWADRHDNGALVSCGLTVDEASSTGRVYLSRGEFRAFCARYPWRVTEIDRDTWAHSGCQSQCIRRGDTTCRW